MRDAARGLINDPRSRPFNKRTFLRNANAHYAEVARCELAAFARSRRWTVAPRSFPLSRLATFAAPDPWRVIDHEEYLLRNRHPVAILSHTYASEARVITFAKASGLRVEFLEFSWYAPCHATAAVFTSKSAKK
jgi:hypothetical protein